MELKADEVVLIGYSGHGLVVADCALAGGIQVKYYAEKAILPSNPFQLTYLGFEGSDDFTGWGNGFSFLSGIGDNRIRKKIANLVRQKNETLINAIHPSASISNSVVMGTGVLVSKHASINPMAMIADDCILNTGCIVEHECMIGEAAHIGPGAVLSGNVKVGPFSFIGANAVVKQGIQIGANTMIGAGAVVIRDIGDNETWVGNPARRIR